MDITINALGSGVPSSGTYEAAEDKGRRRTPRRRKVAEEAILTQRVRDRVTSTAHDLVRNDPVASWILAKFLDYTTVQYFAARTGDRAFDNELELAVYDWMLAHNCDAARRNDFDTMMRIFGGAIALDGDAALLKITGGFLQGIESDRIRSEGAVKGKIPESVNGVVFDRSTGRASGYLLFDRGPNGRDYVYNRMLAAENLIFRGNFNRFDQVRGVPLLSPAITTFQDAKETDEYQRLKSKKHAAMAIAFMSNQGSGLNDQFNPLAASPGSSGSGDENSGEEKDAYGLYDLDAATKLEMEPGDKIELIESHTPSTEYQMFSDSLLRRGMLPLGIPFSFYNSEKSSYSSMKQDRAEFKFSVQRYLRIMISTRTEAMDWALPQIISDYGLKWSRAEAINYEWIPQADPWLEEDKEVSSALERIAGGLSSPQRECKRRGTDFYDIAQEVMEAQETIRRLGLVMAIGTPGGNLFNPGNLGKTTGGDNNADQ